MQNLKIKLNSESEAEEVKRLAVKAGYKLDALFGRKWSSEFCYLLLCEDMSAGFGNEIMADGDKPLSIGELRDMVVLKRNDVNDATHEDKDDPEFKYRLIDNNWYVITDGNPVWRKDSIDLNEAPLFIKPIEKNMKEYLDKKPDGSYELIVSSGGCVDRDWIEIPELSQFAVLNGDDEIAFYDGNGLERSHFISSAIIWQRDQDEPFLTPECTLNDQYAEIEQVRQAIKVKSGSDSDHALDAMSFGLMGARAAQASGGVDATLAERQSTYGNFEDVAFVTENIMHILAKVRVNGLDDLPNTHRMALYMIASKMARIVNGDFNHLDSWHDIGGYAKLIEKLIKGE